MKIVFLAPFGIRPKGTVIARMIPIAVELQRLGHVVVIIAPPYTNPEDSGKTETFDGVLLKNIQLGQQNKLLSVPVLALRLYRETMSEHPDLIHLFKPKGYSGVAAILILALRSIGISLPPLLVDCDDWEGRGGMNDLLPYSFFEKRFYHFQEQFLIRHAFAVTAASRGLEKMISELKASTGRLLYLPNCVTEPCSGNGNGVRERLGIGKDVPVVLLYTRFFEFKQEKLHVVFDLIHRQVPTVRFLVVGQGRNNEEAMLRESARVEGYSDSLVMAGWVEPSQLPDYIAAGDVAIYPFADTLLNRCKCPAKLTELLRAGCPVVGDRVGQISEYIRHGISGFLCDPNNQVEMASKVVELLNNPELRHSIGAVGRQYLLKEFAWPVYAGKLSEFYRELQ